MEQFLRHLLILAAVVLLPRVMSAQTTPVPDTVPYFCDFEDANENASWVLENGTCYNRLTIDTGVNVTVGGTSSLYVAEENTWEYHYKIGSGVAGDVSYVSSRVFAYRDIYFPEAGTYEIGYWWNCMGENQFDFGRVALAPVSWVFTASTVDWDSTTSVPGQFFGSSTIPNVDGWQVLDRGHYLSGIEAPEYFYTTFEVAAAGTYRLVVTWNNDGNTGVNPPLMIDDISINLLTCPRPTLSVGNLSQTSVTFNWVENGNANTWYIDWDTAGVTSLSHHDTLHTNTYTLNNLTPGGSYTFNLRAYCDVDDLSRIAAYNLTMPTCPFIDNLPYTFDFDSATVFGSETVNPSIPCWTYHTNGLTAKFPYLYNGYAHTGNHSLYFYYSTSNNYTTRGGFVLPGVDPQYFDIRNVVMNFWAHNGSSDAYLLVGVCGDPGNLSTFVTVDTVRIGTGDVLHSIPLSNYNGAGNYPAIIMAPVPSSTYYTCYIDDIELTYEPCGRPGIFIDSVTPYEATVSWNSNGAYSYMFGLNDTVNATTTNETSITLDTLSPNTVYTVWVKALCTVNNSHWSSRTFTTGCAPMTILPWSEDMESTSTGQNTHPNCWTFLTDATNSYSGYPYVYNYNYYAHSGTNSIYMYMPNNMYGSVGDPTYQICVLPEIDTLVAPLNEIRLSFWASSYDYGTKLYIGTMTNAYNVASFVRYDSIVLNSETPQQFVIDMDRFEGGASFLAVAMFSMSMYQVAYMDDFTLSLIPDCRAVSNVVVSNLSQTSADISWTESDEASSWNVTYYADGEPASTATVETVYDTVINLTDLEEATLYHVSIAPVCDGVSETYSLTFTTPCSFVDSLPLVIDFENVPLQSNEMVRPTMTCWSFPNPGTHYMGYPQFINYMSHSGNNSSYWYHPYSEGNYGTNYMVSPGIDLDVYPISNIVVSFWAVTDWGDVPSFEVGVMTNPNDISTFVPCQTVTCTLDNYDWELLTASLSNYTGTGNFIAIRSIPQTELDWPEWYGYVDDITIEYVDCAPVLPIVSTTSDSAYLSWMGTASGYELNITGPSFSFSDIVTDNALELGELLPNTVYTVMMRQICGSDTSSWTTSTFRTQCGYITLPYVQGFENEVGSAESNPEFINCWDRITDASNYYHPYVQNNSNAAHTGNKGIYWYHTDYDYYAYGSYTTLLLPELDPEVVTSVSNLQLTFWAKDDYSSGNYQFVLGVYEYNVDDSVYVFVPVDTATVMAQSDWTAYELTLANYTGTGTRIAFAYLAPYTSFWCYLDDFELDYIPTCRRPDNVAASAITTATANISWTHETATEFVVTCTDPSGNTTSQAVTGDSTTVTGLSPNTDYVISVYAVCSAGDTSRASYAYTFHTECVAVDVLPYTEDFENAPLGDWQSPFTVECWHRLTDATQYPYMYVDSWGAHGGMNCIYWYNDNYASAAYGTYKALISPMIDPSIPMDTLQVSFWLASQTYGGQPEFSVGIMTDPYDINSFVEIETITHTSMSSYEQYEVSFAGYTGTGRYIAIKTVIPSNYNYMYVDDITIDYLPSCFRTNNLSVDNISSNSATLHWNNNADNSIISYYTAAQATPTEIYVSGDSYTLTGLESATRYYWQVRGVCAPGDTGAISRSSDFMTDLCPNASYFDLADSNEFPSSNYEIPINNFYRYSFTQSIIDSAELNGPFNIEALSLNYVGTASHAKTDCEIYLSKTNETSFLSTSDAINVDSTFVLVYSGALNCNPGWNLFGFDTSFFYDGVGNLLITFIDYSGAYDGTSSTFSVIPADSYKTIYNYTDSYAPDPTSLDTYGGYGSTGPYRPDLRLISCADLCVAPVIAENFQASYDSLSISWTGNADNYEIAIKNVNDAEYGIEIPVSGNSYSFGSLEPATGYMIRVRSICDTDLVSDWAEALFVTDSLPCFNPSGMTVTGIAFASASFDWTAGGEENAWRLRVWNTTFDTAFIVNAHPYTMTGLTTGVEYNAAVLSLCGDNLNVESNDWSNTVTFTTNICDEVSGVSATVNSYSATATISWTPGANNNGAWEVRYGLEDFTNGEQIADVPATTNNVTLNNLEAWNTYDVYVRAKCEEGIYSNWSTKISFYVDLVGIHTADDANVAIYPNPASGSTTISLAGIAGQVSIAIVDMNGRTVRNDNMECDGNCVKTIDVEGLAQGAYFVRVMADNYNAVKKLIVK